MKKTKFKYLLNKLVQKIFKGARSILGWASLATSVGPATPATTVRTSPGPLVEVALEVATILLVPGSLPLVPHKEITAKVVDLCSSSEVLEEVEHLAPKQKLGGGVERLQLGLHLLLVLELLQIQCPDKN